LPDKVRHTDAVAFLLQTLGRLYFAGVSVDWQALYGEQRPRRVALPTYPFEHRRHWFRSGSATAADAAAPGATAPSQAQTQAQSFHARPEHLNNAYVAPRNIIEQILVDTCRELLGFERIGVCDNIVELGADSLFTMLLSRKVEQLFQLTISPHHLFSEPTLSSLAETIRAAGAVPDDAANQRQNRRNPALAGYLKILQNVEQMSDQQVDELLAQRAK
jgi:acyl transferase domain-containing protein